MMTMPSFIILRIKRLQVSPYVRLPILILISAIESHVFISILITK